MALPQARSASIRCNVLTLDGGGVRGLSSLLILQALMEHINTAIQNVLPGSRILNPHDVFGLVSGTSTGGLIAIMIGKLGMTVEECIQAYRDFSKSVFGKKRFRRGSDPSRYSAKRLEDCIKKMIEKKEFEETNPRFSMDRSRDEIACAVVCRELIDPQEIFSLKPEPVLICNSLPCPEKLKCLVIEAARATSAAPTYFPPQIINQRCFIDGAVEYNNPSMATWDHYTVKSRIAALPRTSQHPNTELYHYHGNLNTSMLRFINLGTGDKHKRIRSHRRFTLAPLVPDNVMRLYYLGEIITDKFDTQKIASKMEKLALTSRGSDTYDFTWHRFSADNRVGYVKLDNHRALRRIERSTLGYLAKSETQEKLNRVAKKIAKDYLQEHGQPHIADAEAVIDNTRVDNTAPHEDSMSLGDTTSSNDTTPLLKKTFIVPTTPIADVEPRVSQMPVNETPNSQLIPDPGLSSASSNNPTTPSGPGTSPKTPENSRSVPAPFEAIREFEDEEPSPSWRKRPDAGNDGIVFTDAALEDPSVTAELDALRSSKSSLSFDDRLRAVEAPSRPSERTTESDQSH